MLLSTNLNYSTSWIQKNIFLKNKKYPQNIYFNKSYILELPLDVRSNEIELLLNILISKHEILRTNFIENEDIVIQVVNDKVELKIERHRFSQLEFKKYKLEFVRPFNLANAPLFRTAFIELDSNEKILLLDFHSIIFDNYSFQIIRKEIFELINKKELPNIQIQYKDFVIKQDESIVDGTYKNSIDFWRNEINDTSFQLEFPVDNYKKNNDLRIVKNIDIQLDKQLTVKTIEIVDKSRSSYLHVFLAVFNILLRKITRNEEITVGVYDYNQLNRKNTIGNFTNLLPVIMKVKNDETVNHFIKNIEDKVNTIFEFHNIPFILFEKENLTDSEISCIYSYSEIENDIKVDWKSILDNNESYCNDFTNYALGLFVEKHKNEFVLKFSYLPSAFYSSTIEKFISYFKSIIVQISADLDVVISQVELITNAERQEILYQFNNTQNNFNTKTPIHQLFNEQVIKYPNKVALAFGGIQITYSELNDLSDLLSNNLIEEGLVPFSVVGLLVDRTPEMVIGILSILKCNCIYLPLDADYPTSRMEHMLKDCDTQLVLAGKGLGKSISKLCKLIDISEILNTKSQINREPLEYCSYAYIMYTSGSTGRPKGVLVEQSGIVRLVKSNNYVPLSEETVILQTGAVVFDATTFEMWGVLLNGGKLVLTEKEELVNTNRLGKALSNQNVNTLWLSSAFFNQLIQEDSSIFKAIKWLLVGGDILSPAHIQKAMLDNPKLKIINGYGPTENTTFSTTFLIKEVEYTSIPIGKPISNTVCYILSEQRTLQPIGLVGELFVGGDGLSAGYLNNPEMTQDKFVDNPFILGEKLYRTGDLARWLADGNIEFIGRVDNQVKIRGFRIELGEIERSILEQSNVRDCVVLKRTENQEDCLCAYIVAADPHGFSIESIRSYISKNLPIYMIPSYFVLLDKIPLTINGKINRKELPAPEIKIDNDFEVPNNFTEEKLLSIWSDVLRVDANNISINTSFFQLGGHSLKAARCIARIEKELGVRIGLSDFFKCLTIKKFAHIVESNNKEKYVEIVPALPKRSYPLTTIQRQMYYFYQLNSKCTSYNTPYEMHLSKVYTLNEISSAINTIIARYEILRTNFIEEIGIPFQVVNQNLNINIDYYDLSTITFQQITEKFIRPFNLSSGALIRVAYIVNDASSSILIDQPHIITDAQSLVVIEKELNCLLDNVKLPEIKLQFKDYSEWVNLIIETPYYKKQEQYWLDLYSDEITALELPYDTKPISFLDKRGKMVSFKLNGEEIRTIESFCKDGSTLFSTTFGFFNVFLNKITNQEDIIVSIPVAGRQREDLMDMLGMFVNTLVLRIPFEKEITITGFFDGVRNSVIKALDNQDYPLEDLITNISFARIPGRNPLFDVIFNYLETTVNCEELEWNKIRLNNHLDLEAKFDLTFNVKKYNDIIVCEFEYFCDRFKPSTIDRFIQYFKRIINQVAQKPNIRIADIEITSDQEKQQLLFDLNFTSIDYPKDKTVHELFKTQATRTPDNIAIKFNNQCITYFELNERTDRIAYVLRDNGIKPDDVVGLLMDRSIETVIGMISILKSGGAYLPIDVNYPEDRKEYLIKDSGTATILTTKDQKGSFGKNIATLCVEDLEAESNKTRDIKNVNKPSDLCYVIYTSGTTGNPKGVMVEHRNVVRLFFNEKFQFDFDSDDVWTMFHSHCFDFSVWEIYGALLFGGKLVIIPKLIAMDTLAYLTILREEKVTILNQTPSAFYNLSQEELAIPRKLLLLRYVIFGGEALSPGKLEKWKLRYPSTKLINMFGITETTVHVTYKEIGDYEITNNISNVGKPIPTLSVYIFDKYQKLLPNGIIGEIYVGGAGVARGYLGKKELTDSKFIINPYNSEERLYRSGDLGRVLHTGDIEYIGRIDHQVQLRGFRVELGEIESQLISHHKINEAVVIAKEKEGDKYLIAYYVSAEDINVLEIRSFLSAKLPDYMVPSYYVRLDKLPLTSNGKLDNKALPDPEIKIGDDYIAPSNEIEEKLVEIWSEVLSISKEKISTNSIFFAIGGHSLRATAILAKIHKEFNVRISMSEFFMNSTIKKTSLIISASKINRFTAIKNVEKKEYYLASSPQKRMYLLQQIDANSVVYNMPYIIKLGKEVNIEKVKDAIYKLISRHDSLRTSFIVHENEIVQKIDDTVNCQIEEFRIDKSKDYLKETKFDRVFDLSIPPLLRAAIVEEVDEGFSLMLDTHHIICDGISHSILVHDFFDLYNSKEIKPLRLQYKDYSNWLISNDQQTKISEQGQYWIKRFSHELPLLNLPIDFVRSNMQSYNGANVNFVLSETETEKIKSIIEGNGITLYMILIAVYNVFLSKLSGQKEIIVGTPIASRLHSDLEGVFGMFVNTLAMLNSIDPDKTFKQFLSELKKNTLDAFENQDYQFDDLVERVSISRDTSRNPIFDVMFNLMNQSDYSGKWASINTDDSYVHVMGTSKFDLNLTATDYGSQLRFNFEYSTSLFTESTINRFIKYFINIINQIPDKFNLQISSIGLITAEEKDQIFSEFNNTKVDYPRDETIISLFEKKVLETPDNIALKYGQGRKTYRELKHESDKIAYYLKEKHGVGANDLVGVLLQREEHLIPAIYGILKAGGTYVPIDSNYPEERVNTIIDDSKIKVLITREKLLKPSIKNKCRIADLDIDITTINAQKEMAFDINVMNNSLAYVIYTSGSTGKPKGVMIRHNSLLNMMNCIQRRFPVNEDDTYLLKTTCCFDVSIAEIFGWFLNGGSLSLLPTGSEGEPTKIMEYIDKYKVTHINFVPSMFSIFMEELEKSGIEKVRSLKYIILGGEVIPIDLVNKFNNLGLGLYLENIYGPTEATIYTSSFSTKDIKNELFVSIGKPLANIKIYIVDNYMQIQPIGISGELCIGGIALAKGYLHNEKLTNEKFINNPFAEGEQLYKTGDLARWLPDGNIEYLGRIDNQVKIRGFRIELGEIENVILKHPSINKCVVIARDDFGDKYLCAYIICHEEINESELKSYILKYLPEYMLPAYFVKMTEFPINSNGKLNRSVLPKPTIKITDDFVKPSNQVEEKLTSIWADILMVNKEYISITTSFFSIGGHSLKAIVLLTKIHKDFNVHISMREFLSKPTVKEISEIINKSKHNQFQSIKNIEKREYYALSAQQKRLFVIQQMDRSSIMYNVIVQLYINSSHKIKDISDALNKVVQRHEMLHSGFEYVNNFPVQRVYDNISIDIQCYNIDKENFGDIINKFIKPFDLAKPPLLKAILLQSKDINLLVIDLHHIITDEYSVDMFTTEFNSLIENRPLKNLKLQYKDYSNWNNLLLDTEVIKNQGAYWLDVYKDKIPRLNLIYDKTEETNKKEGLVALKIDKTLTNALYDISFREETTVFSLLLTITSILINKISNENDIVIGVPISGRNHNDLMDIFGFFVNTIPLRIFPEENKKFIELLSDVKEKYLLAFDNKDYQYDKLIDDLMEFHKSNNRSLFNIMFTAKDLRQIEEEKDDNIEKYIESINNRAKSDLSFSCKSYAEYISIHIFYDSSKFKHETIIRYSNYLLEIVKTITQNVNIDLKEIIVSHDLQAINPRDVEIEFEI